MGCRHVAAPSFTPKFIVEIATYLIILFNFVHYVSNFVYALRLHIYSIFEFTSAIEVEGRVNEIWDMLNKIEQNINKIIGYISVGSVEGASPWDDASVTCYIICGAS